MFLFICKAKFNKGDTMDSRTSSILINLDLSKLNNSQVPKEYNLSTIAINKAAKGDKKKVYSNLRSTVKECYLTGSLKYGNNFIM